MQDTVNESALYVAQINDEEENFGRVQRPTQERGKVRPRLLCCVLQCVVPPVSWPSIMASRVHVVTHKRMSKQTQTHPPTDKHTNTHHTHAYTHAHLLCSGSTVP